VNGIAKNKAESSSNGREKTEAAILGPVTQLAKSPGDFSSPFQ
jgi:hypothetical protein